MGMKHGRAGYSIYRSARWAALRIEAKRRDGFQCTSCGARGRLEVHHVQPIRSHPERAYDLGNLACLCPPCHARQTRIENGLGEPKPAQIAWANLLKRRIDDVAEC